VEITSKFRVGIRVHRSAFLQRRRCRG
jgi:hypothetical protein